jgi:hypothetical protein
MQNDLSLEAEDVRLSEDRNRTKNWERWGPYLSERQWATVREDYSAYGSCWDYFPHDHARSRAYRWGEDGLLGITDRHRYDVAIEQVHPFAVSPLLSIRWRGRLCRVAS